MPAASSLLPWFAPRLSRPMIGVLNNLGHEMHYTRGEVLYESPGFFRPLMLVRRGIVARALMDPLHADPLLVSLSGPRALCGSCETLYVQDRMVRRHWCMTSVDVHVVNADLLLRICDQNPLWQRELSNYSAICALSDRLGMHGNPCNFVRRTTWGINDRFLSFDGFRVSWAFPRSISGMGTVTCAPINACS